MDRIDAVNERLDALEKSVLTYRQGLVAEFDRLKHEAEIQKKLSRYARRTWFEMMTYIFIVGLLASDIARAYANNRWWGLVFWTTQHGDGGTLEWVLRGIGLAWQLTVLFVMGKRSQVPPEVFDRVPYAEVERTRTRRRR